MSSTETQRGPFRPGATRLIVIVGLLLGLALGWLLLSRFDTPLFGPAQLHGTVFQTPEPAAAFTLTGQASERVSLGEFRSQVVLLYFGYTYCPDVCPTTLSNLARAIEKLGRNSDRVQVIMISVDPIRDTPEAMARYVTGFDPTFIGLTGTADEIATVAGSYGIYYQKQEGTAQTGYLVDHTAAVMVIDKAGNLRLIYPLDTPSDDIAADLRHLLRE